MESEELHSEEQQQEQQQPQPPPQQRAEDQPAAMQPVLLRKSSSRDYSRVMCESTLGRKMERQASMRGAAAAARVASKKSYFGHHLFGCFPGRRSSRSSSLQLIPKLVLAPDGATGVAEIIGRAARCGSTKGGPSFSRVPPSDASRGNYSEPTSPQVTCIGQVKTRKKHSSAAGGARSKALAAQASSSSKNQQQPQLQRSRSGRKSGGFELQRTRSGRVLTRSASGRSAELNTKAAEHQEPSSAGGSAAAAAPEQTPTPTPPPPQEVKAEYTDNLDSDKKSRESPTSDDRLRSGAALVAQHKQLVREVSQALNLKHEQRHRYAQAEDLASSSATTTEAEADAPSAPTSSAQTGSSSAAAPTTTTPLSELLASSAAAAAALSRLDSLHEQSPRACLWMRRSMGRPIALDLRK